MPSREEQFDQWYENASRDDLLEAALEKKKASLEDDFKSSRAYRTACDEFIIDDLESGGEMDDFDENAWYNEADDTTDEDEEEASEEADNDEDEKEDGD